MPLPIVMTLLLGLWAQPGADPSSLQALARTTLARIEQLRGQKLSRPLTMGVKTKPQVTRFIQERLRDEYGPAKVTAEGELLQLSGLLPAKLDYGTLIAMLLTEQVAGFYDHTRQELYIADWLPMMLQAPVMAHEIFHAIQDQEWGGGALIDSKRYTHDEVLAHAALLEGDATIVMFNYQQSLGGGARDVSTSLMTMSMLAASIPLQMSSRDYPIMAASPEYMKQSLVFPYQQGMLFVSALRQSGWSWARIREIYRSPPSSTEQVLHPERYRQLDVPSRVRFPPLPGATHRWEGTAGEFHMRQLLMSTLPVARASEAAAGWDGDLMVLDGDGPAAVVMVASTWDSAHDASVFSEALVEAHRKHTPRPSHLRAALRGTEVYFALAHTPARAETALTHLRKTAKIERR